MPRNIDAIRRRFDDPPVDSIIEGALIRPAMYTIGGTVPEVAAFLEGYFSALAKHPETQSVPDDWLAFTAFVGAETSHVGWHEVYANIAARFDTDDEAFDWLLTMYLQFKSTPM